MSTSSTESHYGKPVRRISIYVGLDETLRKIYLGLLSNRFGTLGQVREPGDGIELKTLSSLFSVEMAKYDHIYTDLSLEIVENAIGLCEENETNEVLLYELCKVSPKGNG